MNFPKILFLMISLVFLSPQIGWAQISSPTLRLPTRTTAPSSQTITVPVTVSEVSPKENEYSNAPVNAIRVAFNRAVDLAYIQQYQASSAITIEQHNLKDNTVEYVKAVGVNYFLGRNNDLLFTLERPLTDLKSYRIKLHPQFIRGIGQPYVYLNEAKEWSITVMDTSKDFGREKVGYDLVYMEDDNIIFQSHQKDQEIKFHASPLKSEKVMEYTVVLTDAYPYNFSSAEILTAESQTVENVATPSLSPFVPMPGIRVKDQQGNVFTFYFYKEPQLNPVVTLVH